MELKQFFFKTLILAGVIIGFYVMYEVRSLLMLFFVAILFGSTVRPFVVKLSERGVPVLASTVVSYLGFLGLLVGVIVLLFPSLLAGLHDLANSQSVLLQRLDETMRQVQSWILVQTGFRTPNLNAADLQEYLTEFQASSQTEFDEILLDGVRIISEALILFVMAFYWLTERDQLEGFGLRMFPLQHRERFRSIFQEVETTLGGYVRGQLIVCVSLGIFVFIALTLLDVRSALVLAAFAAVVEIIPLVGPLIGAVPAILVALLDSPEKALLVTVAFVIIQQLEAQILVPKVMERQVGLSPLLVLLALAAGNLLAGLFGAIIAIPIAAAANVIMRRTLIESTEEARKLPVVDGGVLLPETDKELPKPGTSPRTLSPGGIELPSEATRDST